MESRGSIGKLWFELSWIGCVLFGLLVYYFDWLYIIWIGCVLFGLVVYYLDRLCLFWIDCVLFRLVVFCLDWFSIVLLKLGGVKICI